MTKIQALKFTPLEFETQSETSLTLSMFRLKFTPLEFETHLNNFKNDDNNVLKFTPLEFETSRRVLLWQRLKLKFTPLEFETLFFLEATPT